MRSLAHLPVEALIPHRPPMQLLTRIISASDTVIWSLIELDRQSPFVDRERNQVGAVITMEYLAQTAAAFFSVQSFDDQKAPSQPRPGMLIGCSKLTCSSATIAVPATLAVQASLASALPAAADASALVRFTGKVLSMPAGTEAEPGALTALAAAQMPVAEAALSVFLPAADDQP